MSKIIIGKYTLESLTSGMYSDPFVIYREYIQNAVDAIDDAQKVGIISLGEETISINVFPSLGLIKIIDNGTGIANASAEEILTSIGNSQKDIKQYRGFRGIGRLAALSYCKRLVFQTSAINEPVCSELVIDAEKMSELLIESEMACTSAEHVMNLVCKFSTKKENTKKHYFTVSLEGIDLSSPLLNPSEVLSYLQQTAPVSFNKDEFTWHKEIKNRIKQLGYVIPEYNVSLSCNGETIPIYKSYTDHFPVDRNKDVYDTINDIEVSAIKNDLNEIIAIIWIAHTNYIATIANQCTKGIRIRKGNLLIGDSQTLNTVFKDARFNGWTLGEAYILSNQLLPNARRDNFEKNTAYFSFAEKMTAISASVSKKIRIASVKRNEELNKTIRNKKAHIKKTHEDHVGKEEIIFAKRKKDINLSEIEKLDLLNDNVDIDLQSSIFNELDVLIGRTQGVTSYKSINLLGALSKTEKRILEKVFKVLEANLTKEQMQTISDQILSGFSSR